MTASDHPSAGIWPITLMSARLCAPAWTFWGTAPVGDGDWFLARSDRILLFDSIDSISEFVSRGSKDHCFGVLPDWSTLAKSHLAEEVHQVDFDEEGMWLLDGPDQWDSTRRAEVLDRLNLLWDAATQFDDKKREGDLRGGGRGSLLGHLADALMESDEDALRSMAPSDLRIEYLKQSHAFFARCLLVTD